MWRRKFHSVGECHETASERQINYEEAQTGMFCQITNYPWKREQNNPTKVKLLEKVFHTAVANGKESWQAPFNICAGVKSITGWGDIPGRIGSRERSSPEIC